MSDVINFASRTRAPKADSAPKEMVDIILAAGGTRDKAEWVYKELLARTAPVPGISANLTIPPNNPMLKEAAEELSRQIAAREHGYIDTFMAVLCELYNALWPPNDGGGNREVA